MKKLKLKTITMARLRSFDPCYDPAVHLPETFKGTVVDLLKHKTMPPEDKLRAARREEFLSARLLRRFAVAQAKTCRKYVQDKKEFDRILKVCSLFAEGKATKRELADARLATRLAVGATECSAGRAAWYTAEIAAGSVAEHAAEHAARDVVSAVAYTAEHAARSAVEIAAVKMLLKMVRAEYKEVKK